MENSSFASWKRVYFLILVLSLFNGCAYSTIEKRFNASSGEHSIGGRVIYVMLSPDGSYGNIQYNGSGRQLSMRVLEIVRQRYPLSQLIEISNELEAIRQTKARGATHLISPTIQHWEDRATAWSGFRDKVRISLKLIGLESRQVISASEFESRNNSITFLNTHPQDLLDEDFEEAVFALFDEKA
ncbi:MAG: DUF4823 domain-containing protein [Pseudomonadota bacterium]